MGHSPNVFFIILFDLSFFSSKLNKIMVLSFQDPALRLFRQKIKSLYHLSRIMRQQQCQIMQMLYLPPPISAWQYRPHVAQCSKSQQFLLGWSVYKIKQCRPNCYVKRDGHTHILVYSDILVGHKEQGRPAFSPQHLVLLCSRCFRVPCQPSSVLSLCMPYEKDAIKQPAGTCRWNGT